MIKGLYEAHLRVTDLERSIRFYEVLGLEFDHGVEDRVAFLWIEKEKSWLGLWQTEMAELNYHPSIRHLAFRVELEDLRIRSTGSKKKVFPQEKLSVLNRLNLL